MPDPKQLLALIQRAAILLRATPGRKGAIVHLDGGQAEDVMVVGDLHGNLYGLRRILETAQLDQNPKRHLILQELVHGRKLYPNDGGDQSHQLVDFVVALKCKYPNRVHVILGNHELAEITGRVIGKAGMILNEIFRQGIDTAYGAMGADIYKAYIELFKAMPLAVRTPNRVCVCHTIPDGSDLEAFDLNILKSGIWTEASMQRGGAVYAMTWGRDSSPETADRFASMMEVDCFVNGHQPCPETGFMQPNHRQLIIDGTTACPTYCLFPANDPITIDQLLENTRLVALPTA